MPNFETVAKGGFEPGFLDCKVGLFVNTTILLLGDSSVFQTRVVTYFVQCFSK